MRLHTSLLGTCIALAALIAPVGAQTPPGTRVGMLNCTLAPSIGFIVGSHQPMACRFTPDGPFPQETYSGVINTIGLDVGFTAGGALAWAVFAPTSSPTLGALAGVYVGASGNIGLGVGVGANVLFGGSGSTIALQPVSLEGTVSVNLSLGVSGMELRPAP